MQPPSAVRKKTREKEKEKKKREKKHVFCRDKSMLLRQIHVCRDKHNFVAASILLSQQAHFCRIHHPFTEYSKASIEYVVVHRGACTVKHLYTDTQYVVVVTGHRSQGNTLKRLYTDTQCVVVVTGHRGAHRGWS